MQGKNDVSHASFSLIGLVFHQGDDTPVASHRHCFFKPHWVRTGGAALLSYSTRFSPGILAGHCYFGAFRAAEYVSEPDLVAKHLTLSIGSLRYDFYLRNEWQYDGRVE